MPHVGTSVGGPPRLMVVDDDRDIREALSEVLQVEGYEVIEAANGREALERAHAMRPSLILLDLFMPVMDGLEFRRVQMSDPELLGIPVVILSAASGLAQRVAGLRVDALLEKPMRIEALLDVVSRFVKPSPSGL